MSQSRRYSVAKLITGPATLTAFAELLAGGKAIDLYEISFSGALTADTSVGLIRTLTVGTQTTALAGQGHSTHHPAATGNVGTAWSVVPTVATPALYHRQFSGVAGDKVAVVWPFDLDDFQVPAGQSIALWNYGTGTASNLQVTFVWEERYF